MAKYKFKEKDNITNVLDGETVIAKYKIDYHWVEKNVSYKDEYLCVRLYNRMKGYIDCKVELNKEEIQNIPQS